MEQDKKDKIFAFMVTYGFAIIAAIIAIIVLVYFGVFNPGSYDIPEPINFCEVNCNCTDCMDVKDLNITEVCEVYNGITKTINISS